MHTVVVIPAGILIIVCTLAIWCAVVTDTHADTHTHTLCMHIKS